MWEYRRRSMERAELRLPIAAATSAPQEAADLIDGARRVFSGLGAPSPLGMVLFSLNAGRLSVATATGAWGLASGYALMGYACRVAEAGRSLDDERTATLRVEVPCTRGGDVDYAGLLERPEEIAALSDCVTTISADLDLFIERAWMDFEREAAKRLRRHYLRRGAVPSSLPPDEQAFELLRLGYALRILDEVVGESPSGSVSGPSLDVSSGVPLDADEWVDAAASTVLDDFEASIEALLEAGVPLALGAPDGRTFLESDDGAVASADARLGFALRRREQRVTPSRAGLRDAFSTEAASLERLEAFPDFVSDVVRYGYCGGADAAIASVPGPDPAVRAAALSECVERRCGDTPHRTEDEIRALVRYGYLLHRALELRSDTALLVDDGDDRGHDGGD